MSEFDSSILQCNWNIIFFLFHLFRIIIRLRKYKKHDKWKSQEQYIGTFLLFFYSNN